VLEIDNYRTQHRALRNSVGFLSGIPNRDVMIRAPGLKSWWSPAPEYTDYWKGFIQTLFDTVSGYGVFNEVQILSGWSSFWRKARYFLKILGPNFNLTMKIVHATIILKTLRLIFSGKQWNFSWHTFCYKPIFHCISPRIGWKDGNGSYMSPFSIFSI
jgi:hypothetical protein